MIAEKKTVKLHRNQRLAIQSTKKLGVICSGIQGGKTFTGAIKSRNRVHRTAPHLAKASYLVTAPTTKIFYQATLPAFLDTFKGMGIYKASKAEFELGADKKIYLRTVHDPDAIEGITNCEHVWGDEAGMYKRKAMTNIYGRAAFREAPIDLTTTPYALNWLWKDIYKPWKAGKRPDVDFFQFASIENPFFPKAEFERQRSLLDPKVFAMKYLGQFERMAGLVYADLHDFLNFCEPFVPNSREYFMVGGIDFGFSNPFAVVVRAMRKNKTGDYQVDEFYESYLDTDSMVEKCMELQIKWGIDIWYADSEDPQGIADLNSGGIKVLPAKKGPGSIKNGIINHNALIKSREYKIFSNKCPETEDEYATYHYPEDDGQEKNVDENPIDNHNHLMKANEYVTTMTKSFRRTRNQALKPKVYNTIFEEEKELYGLDDITETETAMAGDWDGIS